MTARRRPRFACACAAAAAALLVARATHGHGLPPLPLALWGPFAAPTVDCLRQVSHAARRCFHTALTAQRRCVDAQLEGRDCDTGARDAAIVAARERAAATVDSACLGGQLTELRFTSPEDARSDVLRACGEADTTLRMIYAPALNPVVAPGLSASERRCIAQIGMNASKLVMATVREQSRLFDTVATHIMPPSEKLGRLAAANRLLAGARLQMAERTSPACARLAVYGRDPLEFLTLLERRSACVLSPLYSHVSIACPTPVCGDGIVDGAEACDDANGTDADGCRSDCTVP